MIRFSIITFVVLLLSGCESAFSPKGPYEEKLIVYSILVAKSDTQFVRVYTTYNPSGFDPLEITTENAIKGAQVLMSTGAASITFRDTMVARTDRSRFAGDIPAYIAYPFTPQAGSTYTLSVATQSNGTVTASTTVPGHSVISVENPYVMRDPQRFPDDIALTLRIPPSTRGYLVRLFLNYLVNENGSWVAHREEAPSAIYQSGSEQVFVYPRLVRRSTNPSFGHPFEQEVFTISNTAYRALFDQIITRYAGRLQLRNAVFVMTQVEEHLYNYYNVINGFQDQYSIRTDLPDYSNIQGGVGVFGAMTEDSVKVDFL